MAETETYLLGVDGGGTGCRAAIARRDGAILGTASGGPANATTDPETAAANVLAAAREAATNAGLSEDVLTGIKAHLGLAGILSDAQATAFAARLPFAATVSDDRLTSLVGALGDQDGVLAAVGTGSLLGVSQAGEHRFFGGWGLQVGDQASGAWLGRGLLEQVLLAHDGLVPTTPLTEQTLARFDNDPNAIVSFARNAAPSDYAQLAPEIVEAAEANDPTGLALIAEGVAYLEAAFTRLDPTNTLSVCLAGGLGQRYASRLNTAFTDRLIAPRGTALDGALRLAGQVS